MALSDSLNNVLKVVKEKMAYEAGITTKVTNCNNETDFTLKIGDANACANTPWTNAPAGTYFALRVTTFTVSTTKVILQAVSDGEGFYQRIKVGNSAWSAWKKSSVDLLTALKIKKNGTETIVKDGTPSTTQPVTEDAIVTALLTLQETLKQALTNTSTAITTSLNDTIDTLAGRVTTNETSIGTLNTNVGTNTSAISTLQTSVGDIQTSLGDYALKTYVDNAISSVVNGMFNTDYTSLANLKANISKLNTHTIYLVPATDTDTDNIKDEYILVGSNVEKIGSTKVNLAGYATEAFIKAITGDTSAVGKTLQAQITELSTRFNELIATGGEPNVINTIKVNNVALSPDSNKAVNIDLTSYFKTENIDNALKMDSTNPVQNKVVAIAINNKQDALTDTQLEAVNSGITATEYGGNAATATDINGTITKEQLETMWANA